MTAQGTPANVTEKLEFQLDHISKAPLKPQQRFFILRTNVIPATYHQLVLAQTTAKHLKYLDRQIRKAVRKWLHLPHDTPLPYFHADVKDGGLGLRSLQYTVPGLKQRRMIRLQTSRDPAVSKAAATEWFTKEHIKWCIPLTLDGSEMSTPELRWMAWLVSLMESVDRRGLKSSAAVPYVHRWVHSATSLLSGRRYCGAISPCGGLLPCSVRAATGYPERSVACDCCVVPEFLGHILKVFPGLIFTEYGDTTLWWGNWQNGSQAWVIPSTWNLSSKQVSRMPSRIW